MESCDMVTHVMRKHLQRAQSSQAEKRFCHVQSHAGKCKKIHRPYREGGHAEETRRTRDETDGDDEEIA